MKRYINKVKLVRGAMLGGISCSMTELAQTLFSRGAFSDSDNYPARKIIIRFWLRETNTTLPFHSISVLPI